ncbi:MAG: hypothetical protein ACMG5Z_05410 [Luteimonas sp.]
MTDIVLHDIDAVLADRIRLISEARGWSSPDTLLRLLEYGLDVCEGDGRSLLDEQEAGALELAITALEQVPNDLGFALIGRMTPEIATTEEPEQRIPDDFRLVREDFRPG